MGASKVHISQTSLQCYKETPRLNTLHCCGASGKVCLTLRWEFHMPPRTLGMLGVSREASKSNSGQSPITRM